MKYSQIHLIISSFAIALLGGFVAVHTAHATEVSPFINTAIAKEETSDTLTAEQRKAILQEIISASLLEVENFTDTLADLNLDEEWSIARDHFLTALATSSEYYADLDKRLNQEDISLEAIKSIAKDLKDWRESTYTPELKEIGNLILIFQTENVYTVVQSRGIKIANDIKKLDRQKLVNTDALKKYLTQAEKSIKNARTLTTKAKDIYFAASIEPLQPKEDISIELLTSTTTIEAVIEQQVTATSSEVIIEPQDQIRDLAKESLKELKTAYELFFKMNDRIRK